MPVQKFEKATLQIERGPKIECWLNPKELTVTRSNSWNAKQSAGQQQAPPQFGGAQPMSLSIELLFDESLVSRDINGGKVKDVVNKLIGAMEPTIDAPAPPAGGQRAGGAAAAGAGGTTRNTKRPPTMTFSWGGLIQPFIANCTQLAVKYILINPDGSPRRAQANLTLQQANPTTASGQAVNPTTRSNQQGLGTHLVKDGDSLPSLAYDYYGSATEWRPIAEANGIDDPIKLRSGRRLFIPRIEL